MSDPILIVEDERALSLALASTVRKTGGTPEIVGSIAKATDYLKSNNVSGMILDIGLPDGNGLHFLEKLAEEKRPPTILVTAHGDIENAISARKLGVLEFFDKPIDFEAFTQAIFNLTKSAKPVKPTSPTTTNTFIGAAPAMRPVFQSIAHACASDEPVLVTGDTGTGKTTVINLVAANGKERANEASLVRVSPGVEVENLKQQLNTLDANTIVLIDPIEDLSLDLQSTLLNELEARRFRLLASASRDLLDQVGKGDFRSDLYYRLQVLEIRLPALSERVEDIPALASYFIGQIEFGQNLTASQEFYTSLENHDWPGNLRELKNAITYATTIGKSSSKLSSDHLPEYFKKTSASKTIQGEDEALSLAIDRWLGETEQLDNYKNVSGKLERLLIEKLLVRFEGKLAPMASALNANRTTLRKKLGRK